MQRTARFDRNEEFKATGFFLIDSKIDKALASVNGPTAYTAIVVAICDYLQTHGVLRHISTTLPSKDGWSSTAGVVLSYNNDQFTVPIVKFARKRREQFQRFDMFFSYEPKDSNKVWYRLPTFERKEIVTKRYVNEQDPNDVMEVPSEVVKNVFLALQNLDGWRD